MAYVVVKGFLDLQDYEPTKDGPVYHEYSIGDMYPRKGVDPSPERIAELAGPNNKIGVPLIEFAGGEVKEPEVKEEEVIEIDKMSKKELAEFAKEQGVKFKAKATKQEILDACLEQLR